MKKTISIILSIFKISLFCSCGTASKQTSEKMETSKTLEKDSENNSKTYVVSLSSWLNSDELHIMYWSNESSLAKDKTPDCVYIIKDNKISCYRCDLTFGDISKMSDDEIHDYLIGDYCETYVDMDYSLELYTDASGNNSYCEDIIVEVEVDIHSNDYRLEKIKETSYEAEIYDDYFRGMETSYSGILWYKNVNDLTLCLDEPDTKGIIIDGVYNSTEDNNLESNDAVKDEIFINPYRGYTVYTTIDEIISNEKSLNENNKEPDWIKYESTSKQVFNEELQIYEYIHTGEYTDVIQGLYYKNVSFMDIQPSYGMSIGITDEKATYICYYLSSKEFEEFIEIYGESSFTDDNEYMHWKNGIKAKYFDNLGECYYNPEIEAFMYEPTYAISMTLTENKFNLNTNYHDLDVIMNNIDTWETNEDNKSVSGVTICQSKDKTTTTLVAFYPIDRGVAQKVFWVDGKQLIFDETGTNFSNIATANKTWNIDTSNLDTASAYECKYNFLKSTYDEYQYKLKKVQNK